MERKHQINLWYFILAAMGVILLRDYWVEQQQVQTVPYSQFQDLLKKGQVDNVVVQPDRIVGSYRTPDGKTHQFSTTRVEPDLAEQLSQYPVKFSAEVPNRLLTAVLSWVVPALVFVGVWMFLIRRFANQSGLGGGGLMSIGRSKAKVYVETDTKTTFKDVAGIDEAKADLQEVVAFLKNPAEYGRLGARMPKGILLVGPPGTGKTLLARAVAGEAGVPFFSISGSEFVEMFVGVGAARVRDLFEQAKKQAPCIIFIDELDALGRARGPFSMGGQDEKEHTLNQLLAELDGFDRQSGIVLLAATNRPEILDQALLRAGRFDRQVLVDRPDRPGRLAILQVHVRKVVLAPGVDLERVAAITIGFTGADLANLVNEAALNATRRRSASVEQEDFTQAVERIVAGLEKRSRVLSPPERKRVAVHESGHALVAMALPGSDRVQKVSIVPRGIGALGYTLQRPTEDRFLTTRGELENRLSVLLAGRAAEALVFGEISTGAADDLRKVTEIARDMVIRLGMDETVGNLVYSDEPSQFLGVEPGARDRMKAMSEQTAQAVDAALRRLVDEAFARATAILTANRALLDETAERLIEHETLDEGDLAGIEARVARPAA